MIPTTVITGFLGAGKSTMVQRWLDELPRLETAVIVNERGDIGIDGELLSAHVARLREITGGCICCRSQVELVSALEELSLAEPPPKRILVETSGAASPGGVVRAIARIQGRLRLDGVVTVLDITRLASVLAYELAVEQLAFADLVVLSHADRSTPEQVTTASDTVGELAPAAVLVCASRGEPTTPLLELLAQRPEVLRLPKESPHPAIEAVSLSAEGALDDERFGAWVETALGRVQSRILRIKGILAMAGVDHRVILQGVGEGIEVQLGAPWEDAERSSRLVILGLSLDASELEAGFEACRR